MAQNTVPAKIIPGIKGGCFCVDPGGNFAYIFVGDKLSFGRVDLKTGQHTTIETERSKRFELAKSYVSYHNGVLRFAKHFIFSIFNERCTKNYFTVSFAVNDDVISIEDERAIDIPWRTNVYICHHIRKEQRFFFTYDHNEVNTIFDVTQIEINENGKIVSTILARNQLLNGSWRIPFIHEKYCYWVPLYYQNRLKKLMKVSFDNGAAEKIEVKKEFKGNFSWNDWSYMLVNGDHIIFIVSTMQKNNALLIFAIKDKCWRKIDITAERHIMVNSYFNLKTSANGFLYIHGDCSFKQCKDQAHIFIIDIKQYLSVIF